MYGRWEIADREIMGTGKTERPKDELERDKLKRERDLRGRRAWDF